MKQIMIALLLFSSITEVLLTVKWHYRKPKHLRNRHSRIIKGLKTYQPDYLFIASILTYGAHTCGGSIISTSVILTAAHCCIDHKDKPIKTKFLSVVVGSTTWSTGKKFKLDKYIVHERFDSEDLSHDIALLYLTDKLSHLNHVKIVRLARAPLKENVRTIQGTVLGWGYTSKDGKLIRKTSEDLLRVDLQSIPLNQCKMTHPEVGDGQICFSGTEGRGTCSGDSGGPLVMKKGVEMIQIGVVSFGHDCNNTQPEVYTRIPAYYKWIKENVRKNRKISH